jgi:hypothetical protein
VEDAMRPSVPEPGGNRPLATFLDGSDQPHAMRYAYREMLTPRMIRLVLAALTAVVAVFAIIGPISTYEMLSPLRRLAYWSLWYFVAWPVCFCMSVVTLYWLRDRSARAASLALAGTMLIAAVPATGIVCSIEHLMRPDCTAGLFMTYIRVLAVMLPATLLVHFIVLQRVKQNGAPDPADLTERTMHPGASGNVDLVHHHNADHNGDGLRRAVAHDVDTAKAPEPGSVPHRFTGSVAQPVAGGTTASVPQPRSVFGRLPRKLGTDLIYLKVDDHYVKAHTPAGSAIILMRFADAVADLSAHGLQVHRSYWVARRYMKCVMQKDGRTVLRLTTGQDIPVSRTYLHAVRAALGDLRTG